MSYIKKESGTTFEKFVGGTIANVPFLAIVVIAGNYVMMGWATAALLTVLLSSVTTGVYIAWGVGLFASLGRGSLVFLPNFDPDKPDFSWRGERAAVAFTALFLYEIVHLVLANNLNVIVAISLGTLAIMGCVLEILTVGNIKRRHNANIASDPERVKRYIETMSAIANMEALEDEVQAAMRQPGQFFDLGKFRGHFDDSFPANPTPTLPAGDKIGKTDRSIYREEKDAGFPLDLTPNGTPNGRH